MLIDERINSRLKCVSIADNWWLVIDGFVFDAIFGTIGCIVAVIV